MLSMSGLEKETDIGQTQINQTNYNFLRSSLSNILKDDMSPDSERSLVDATNMSEQNNDDIQ